MKWPDFVIIGSMKCGTTALWRNLDLHPDIQMARNPLDPKKTGVEIRFWNNGAPKKTWKRGFDWYKGLFEGKCCGEKCANYIESPKAMSRLHRAIPRIKLVLCVRNPVDRILSEFWMHHFKAEKIKKFARFSQEWGPRIRGAYIEQLDRSTLPLFDRDQIYVVVQERMKADTAAEMNKLYEWLGQKKIDLPVSDVSFIKRNAPLDGYRRWETSHSVDMCDSLREDLEKYYRKLNRRFYKWLGYRIEEWE